MVTVGVHLAVWTSLFLHMLAVRKTSVTTVSVVIWTTLAVPITVYGMVESSVGVTLRLFLTVCDAVFRHLKRVNESTTVLVVLASKLVWSRVKSVGTKMVATVWVSLSTTVTVGPPGTLLVMVPRIPIAVEVPKKKLEIEVFKRCTVMLTVCGVLLVTVMVSVVVKTNGLVMKK
jgi:small-conductance mechanosensitive channel